MFQRALMCSALLSLTACYENGLNFARPSDMQVLPDFTTLPDLTVLPDFTVLPDLTPTCVGKYGICAVTGYFQTTDAGTICSTDVGGSESRAVPEVCDNGIDEDCNGLIDSDCPEEMPVHMYFGGRNPDPYMFWYTLDKGILHNGHFVCFGEDGVYTVPSQEGVNNGKVILSVFPSSSVGKLYACQITGTDTKSEKFVWSDTIWFIR